MTAAVNVYGNVREYGTDLDVFGNVFEWPGDTGAAIVTTRLTLIGTSRKRLSINGTSRERMTISGTSGKRLTIEGSSR